MVKLVIMTLKMQKFLKEFLCKMYIIYLCINKINQKKYIGITSRTLKKRFINHFSEAYNKNSNKYNTPFKQAIRKYGKENFDIKILEQVNTLEEANMKEIYYIKFYNSYCYQKNSDGYNATLGGDGVKNYNKIVKIDPNTGDILEFYNTISEAETKNNISHISECINGKFKTAGGFCWEKYDKYINLTQNEKE